MSRTSRARKRRRQRKKTVESVRRRILFALAPQPSRQIDVAAYAQQWLNLNPGDYGRLK